MNFSSFDYSDDYDYEETKNKERYSYYFATDKEIKVNYYLGFLNKLSRWSHKKFPKIASQKWITRLPPGFYTMSGSSGEEFLVPSLIVSDNMMRFKESQYDIAISEIKKIWTLKPKFDEMGYVFKRGFLLYGPPGSGKTSTINIVCKEVIERGGVCFNVNGLHPYHVKNLLTEFRRLEPTRMVLVIFEDIDVYLKQRDEAEVLSLLDGQNSIDGALYIATTNYPENLDGRIVNRPSRFDRLIFIDTPDEQYRYQFILQNKTGLTEKEVQSWAKRTKGFSFAHIKELIISVLILGGDLESEEKRIRKMFKAKSSSDSARALGFGSPSDEF